VDGLPLGIELAAARVNVLGLAELVSIFERRSALLRDSPASDPARNALQELVDWSYDLLHGDEKALLQQLAVHRGGASLASLAAVGATRGLNEATVRYLVAALVDKSIVAASFSGGAARYDLLDSVREYVLDVLAENGGLASAREAHAEYFASLAEEAWGELRGPGWLAWERRLAPENDNFWAALAYAREGPAPGVAARLGTLGWYFILAERVSEGRRYLELALSAAGEDGPADSRIELLATLCYLAAEELDLGAAMEVGERALILAASTPAPKQLGLAQLTLALALAQSGEGERADAMAQAAYETLRTARDDWGAAASASIRATGAAQAGDVPTVAAMAETVRRHADALDYDAFRVPGLLLGAWVAERRGESANAVDGYRRALDLAGRIGFADHAAFALWALGSIALANGDPHEAEELQRQALATAEAAGAPWVAAHTRVQLGLIAAATGDAETADGLYRGVLDWSQLERPHQARESLFVALAGDPAAAAERGLAEIAEPRPDAART
jgi:tetratricopeptide repeat protein